MFYAKSTGGFYDEHLHGKNIPADAVEIAAAQHREFIDAQSQGKRIVADENGFPVLADPLLTANDIWQRVKAERDRRRFDGGVQVGQHWYLSNSVATGEYSVLLQISAGLPDTTVLRQNWRTMDGGLVDMTPALARQIINAGFARVAEIDDAALVHKAAIEASNEPASYDYSTGWPQTYAEWAAEQA